MEDRAVKLLAHNTGFDITGTAHSLASLRPGHVVGARDAKNVTLLALYRVGAVSVAQIMSCGHVNPKGEWEPLAKLKDHMEAMKHGIALDDLVKAGVNLRRLESSRVQQEGRVAARVAAEESAAKANAPKTMMVVRKAGGSQATVVSTGVVPKVAYTATQAQAIAAVVMFDDRQRKLKAALAPRAKGIEVTLSSQERAQLLERNAAKGTPTYTYLPTGK